MSDKVENPYAFPCEDAEWYKAGSKAGPGMTLRDYFAAASLMGIQANPGNNDRNYKEDAKLAYETADAFTIIENKE